MSAAEAASRPVAEELLTRCHHPWTTQASLNSRLTHDEAAVSAVAAVVQAAVGLEQEEAAGPVVIVGGDARHPQTLPLPQQLLLPGEAPVVRAGLGSGAAAGHAT